MAFVWGSAQLMAHEEEGLTPTVAVTDVDAARRHSTEYMFMKCMDAVHRRARETPENDEDSSDQEYPPQPLWRYSYQLWNLTGLSHWHRVNGCLMAAFRQDVLARFEVVRSLMFGELLKFTRNPRPPGVSFYDCCVSAQADADAEIDRVPSVGTELLLDRGAEEELFE